MPNDTPNFLICPAFPELPPSSSPSQEKPNTPIPAEPRHRHVARWIALGAALLLVLMLIPPGISLTRAWNAGRTAERSISAAREKLLTQDVEGAKTDLDAARASLLSFRDELQKLGSLRDLPALGLQIRALEDAASAGSQTLYSAADILDIAVVILDALRSGAETSGGLQAGIAPTRRFEDLSKEEKRELLQKFSNELPRLRLARDKMDLALTLWSRVPQDGLASPIQTALRPLAEAIPVMKKALDEAVPLLEALLPMSGYPEPRRYLVALQNADEIRPSGGFIGTIGTMTWDAGELSEFAFTDVYNIDNPVSAFWKETPPEPLARYLGAANWFLRDANWSPDFPTSAERVLDFYVREAELQLHAPLPHRPTTFIAFEPGFFRELLAFTGPIVVDGKTFTSDNFFEQLEFAVEVGFHQEGIPVEQRKEIIGKLGQELVKKLFALPSARWPEVLDVATQALERKQIMAYSHDADLQPVLESRGWSARAKPTDGDFLWVVDANLAALKTDGAMKKEIRYELDATDPAGPKATVTLRYTNTAKGFGDYRYTRYRTYTRVYVPEGSELISSDGAMKDDLNKTGGKFISGTVDVFKELGKTVYGAFWSVEPGKTGELKFTYRLPPTVNGQRSTIYHLDWPKQPGVDNATLTLDLSFDKKLESATPSEDSKKWGDARYEYTTDSLTDRTFEISF
ncbi:DUF4012 domain-containing protein [Candidatus Uhrbacteria bacterium]|nr:DUF4012 domain-containing protein [Candidatus Uhrbacteria bacterium]